MHARDVIALITLLVGLVLLSHGVNGSIGAVLVATATAYFGAGVYLRSDLIKKGKMKSWR